MKNNNIITQGANLKRIRRDLDLRQYEIAGEEVTRNLISLIENDKTPLYNNTATIIAKNINNIMLNRNSHVYIQPEDILNPQRYEARKKADRYIKNLENILENKDYEISVSKLNEIEFFLNQWCFIDKKIKIYELLGDIYYKANDLNREYYYYIKALEVSYEYENMKNRYKLILKLVYNYIISEKFEEAIKLCNFALSTQYDMPSKYKGTFYYNIALAYYHLGNNEECLKELINAKYYINYEDYKEMKSILMLEGVTYFKIGHYDIALRSYEKILNMLDIKKEPDELCVAYINMMQIYRQSGNTEEVVKYLNKIIDCLKYINKNSLYLSEIFLEISNTYFYLEEYKLCEKYLTEAFTLVKKHKDFNLYLKTLSNLFDLYIKTGEFDKIKYLVQSLNNYFDEANLSEEHLLTLKFTNYFLEQNNYKGAKDLINSLINKEKRRRKDEN